MNWEKTIADLRESIRLIEDDLKVQITDKDRLLAEVRVFIDKHQNELSPTGCALAQRLLAKLPPAKESEGR